MATVLYIALAKTSKAGQSRQYYKRSQLNTVYQCYGHVSSSFAAAYANLVRLYDVKHVCLAPNDHVTVVSKLFIIKIKSLLTI